MYKLIHSIIFVTVAKKSMASRLKQFIYSVNILYHILIRHDLLVIPVRISTYKENE